MPFIPSAASYGVLRLKINKYKKYIIAKRIRNSQSLSFDFAEKYIFEDIIITPFDLYRKKIREASEIMKNIDEKDAPILALAMQLRCPIWSNDKHFMMQKAVKVYTTGNLLDLWNCKSNSAPRSKLRGIHLKIKQLSIICSVLREGLNVL